jgi:hypothetical protein
METQALENLNAFQERYSGLVLPFPHTDRGTIAALTEIVLRQQEEIAELKEYVEKQKQAESDRSADGLDRYYRGLNYE